MPAIDHPSTELALGGKIYWSELAQQLASVWWEVTEVGGNVQHGDLHTDTIFTVVLPQHGGYCFHGTTPMDAWGKAKKWLMSPDRRFEVELPATASALSGTFDIETIEQAFFHDPATSPAQWEIFKDYLAKNPRQKIGKEAR